MSTRRHTGGGEPNDVALHNKTATSHKKAQRGLKKAQAGSHRSIVLCLLGSDDVPFVYGSFFYCAKPNGVEIAHEKAYRVQGG